MLSPPWVRRLHLAHSLRAVPRLRLRLRVTIVFVAIALLAAGRLDGQVVTFGPVVRVIYLVPSDREIRKDYVRHVDGAIDHVQIWVRNELGNDLSFSMNKKPVEVIQTSHTAAWYRDNPAGDFPIWFFSNVLADGFALTGGQFNDPSNIWVFYIDSDPACGQLTGAAAGVAVLPANDLRGLAGEDNVPPCPGQLPDTEGVCRWVGGLGHELGHALGLPHPPGCEAGDPSCPSNTLMWLGYITYPNTFLLESDKTLLENSPFASPVHIRKSLPVCTKLK